MLFQVDEGEEYSREEDQLREEENACVEVVRACFVDLYLNSMLE